MYDYDAVERTPVARLADFAFKLLERCLILAVLRLAAEELIGGPQLVTMLALVGFALLTTFWIQAHAEAAIRAFPFSSGSGVWQLVALLGSFFLMLAASALIYVLAAVVVSYVKPG